MTKFQRKLWIWLGALALMSPLGILLPRWLKAGDAWGEWGVETIREMLGFVPEGLKRDAEIYRAPIPDYNLGGEGSGLYAETGSYIFSGLLGIILIGLVVLLINRFVLNRSGNKPGIH